MILTCPDDGGLAKDEGGGGDGDHSSARSQQHQSYNKPEIMYNTRLLAHGYCYARLGGRLAMIPMTAPVLQQTRDHVQH